MAERLVPPPGTEGEMGWPAGAIAVGPLVDEALSEAAPAYVADASLFPSASGVNPMITIMALASRVTRILIAASR